MRRKSGMVDQVIKLMMTITGIVLIVLLFFRGISEMNLEFPKSAILEMVKKQVDYGLSYIWKQSYPTAVRQEDAHLIGGKKTPFGYSEVDPAYDGYKNSGRFYEEHQYLMYEGEESKAGEAETGAVSEALSVKGATYRKEQLADYDFLIKHFYNIHTSATAGRDLMRADEFLAKDFTLMGGCENPQILVYHTHSQEAYAVEKESGLGGTVLGTGNYLTELLTQKGYNVIHDTSVYDLKDGKLDRNKAYTYALDGISGILQKYPSIEVVIDLHRDGVNENLHMVHDINGKPTAPIMFFNGVSQTPEGPIEYLPNPYREDNLAFSFQMQIDAEAYYPGLTRKIYIKGLRYNLHLRARSVLIEVGAQTNTYQESLNAMEPLAELLDMVLQGN